MTRFNAVITAVVLTAAGILLAFATPSANAIVESSALPGGQDTPINESKKLPDAQPPSPITPVTPAPVAAGSALPLAGKVILVDPGHGGKDSGAVQSYSSCGMKSPHGTFDVHEAGLNLAMGTMLKDELEHLGATVYMTREGDDTTPLDERVLMQADISLTPRGMREHAAHRAADVSVSVHVNSAGKGTPSSYDDLEVYSYYQPGKELAQHVVPYLAKEMGISTRHIHPMDYRLIDHNPQVPEILVETGYLTHPATCRNLVDSAYQKRMAIAIAHGVLSYLQVPATATKP